jgi:hypothetical protein
MQDFDGTSRKISQSGLNTSKNRLIVFIICLGISVFIWFLIVLSKESFTTIDYPVIFENNPGNYVLSGRQDSILSFTISSGGVALLTMKYMSSRVPIKIDLTNVKVKKDGDYFRASIPASDYAGNIIKRLNLSEEHVSVSPEFINLRFEAMTGRKVKIIPKLRLGFEKQFRLTDSLKTVPDSVNILGQKDIINNIQFIETIEKEVVHIDKPQIVKVGLAIPEGLHNIKLVPDVAEVYILAEEFTESTIEIPVICPNTELKIKTFPDQVKITYNVGLKDFSRVSNDMFLAHVSYSEGDSSAKLKVNIVRSPSFITVVRIEPEDVEFLVLKQ